ncbi:hypothetical protein [Streptomyces goshikiensis]|uniref:hypothetical protein n=1 Tax=Streptomyces goshikiensis TaxID=1942 RepID=UPI0036A983B9
MPEDPGQLVEAITTAVREGDDHRIDLLLNRFKNVADLPDLIRLRRRLRGSAVPRHGTAPSWVTSAAGGDEVVIATAGLPGVEKSSIAAAVRRKPTAPSEFPS